MSRIDELKPMSAAEKAAAMEENKRQIKEDAYLYHRVFVQNKDGSKLLEKWINTYCFSGFTANDATTTELAKAEARREFVSMIISQINRSNEE